MLPPQDDPERVVTMAKLVLSAAHEGVVPPEAEQLAVHADAPPESNAKPKGIVNLTLSVLERVTTTGLTVRVSVPATLPAGSLSGTSVLVVLPATAGIMAGTEKLVLASSPRVRSLVVTVTVSASVSVVGTLMFVHVKVSLILQVAPACHTILLSVLVTVLVPEKKVASPPGICAHTALHDVGEPTL
jgi:hypothetical protein